MTKPVPIYTKAEAAGYLGVSVTTIRTWLNEGKLKQVATVGGKYVLTAASVEKLKGDREIQ